MVPTLMPQTWNWRSHWPAPAKLNLFLHILGRRPDGYHQLQTVFCLLNYSDTLIFSPRTDGQIIRATPLPQITAKEDLALRAARLLQKAAQTRQGVTLSVIKRLPSGAGLGGGSSDAATVLLALNHLWRLKLTRCELRQLGLQLGADVPFFLYGYNAFAEGIGEQLTRIVIPPTWYLLLEPPVHISTAEIFADPELDRHHIPIRPEDWYPGYGDNALQAVACRRYPILNEYIQWLSHVQPARMTGSGACCFASFTEKEDAMAALARLPKHWRGRVVAGLPHHPLLELLPSNLDKKT